MSTPSILDKLKIREKFERRILRDYEELFYRTFQVVYEIDAKVKWERIYRLSEESNFLMIAGDALVPKGTVLTGGRITTKDVRISPSFTIPWCLLDDDASAYQLAEAAKDIRIFSDLVGPREFSTLIRSPDFSYEQLKIGIPDFETLEQQARGTLPPQKSPEMFMEEITQAQMRSMFLDAEDSPSE